VALACCEMASRAPNSPASNGTRRAGASLDRVRYATRTDKQTGKQTPGNPERKAGTAGDAALGGLANPSSRKEDQGRLVILRDARDPAHNPKVVGSSPTRATNF
jgi:hypothetical protein